VEDGRAEVCGESSHRAGARHSVHLHADHEQNCGTNAMRSVSSAQTDPYLSMASAASALAGPLHGGANEEVLKMLDEIGSKDKVPAYIKKRERRALQADGIRTPHLQELRSLGRRSFAGAPSRFSRLRDATRNWISRLELERIALEDEYFVKRKLYPNVDFYSGIMYQAMGFRPEMFTVLFAIPRTAGWLAQWQELITDPEQKIARPRQVYTGHGCAGVCAVGKTNLAAAV
jgi:citrate synthase